MAVTCAVFILGALPRAQAGFPASWDHGAALLLGFPHPINLSYETFTPSRTWSFAAGTGYLPLKFHSGTSDIAVSMTNFDVRGRWHPWDGAFFVGLAFGKQWIDSKTDSIITAGDGTQVATELIMDMSNSYVTPHIGWLWRFDSGFMIGLEFGNQQGNNPESTFSPRLKDAAMNAYLDEIKGTAAYRRLVSEIEDGTDKIGRAKIFYTTILRLGWVF